MLPSSRYSFVAARPSVLVVNGSIAFQVGDGLDVTFQRGTQTQKLGDYNTQINTVYSEYDALSQLLLTTFNVSTVALNNSITAEIARAVPVENSLSGACFVVM